MRNRALTLDRYATQCVNFVLVVTRIAVLGARSAPGDTGNQPRALPKCQGQSPWLVAFAVAVAVALVAPAAGQAPKKYNPPKTPWGDPDLQGVWNDATSTPLQRPATVGEKDVLS